MNNSSQIQKVYIDTSALRGMSFRKDIACLFYLAKQQQIEIYLSETALWERGRQQHENESAADRVLPSEYKVHLYFAWFKALFEKHGVTIIQTDDSIINLTEHHIDGEDSYFSVKDQNDQRDAHVLATAQQYLDLDTLILCGDKNLAFAFQNVGFINIRQDVKKFISDYVGEGIDIPQIEKPSAGEITDLEIRDTFSKPFQTFIRAADSRSHDYLRSLPNNTDKLQEKLANMQEIDAEIRKRLLGFTQWFSPIAKDQLSKLLAPRDYSAEQIENNAQRLKQEDLLSETENHWLTNSSNVEAMEVCEEAMSVVMPEILEILELN